MVIGYCLSNQALPIITQSSTVRSGNDRDFVSNDGKLETEASNRSLSFLGPDPTPL